MTAGSPSLRATHLERLDGGQVDVLVVGGGINGAVSAAALAARGVDVAVIDRGDWASTTSQESSNLVWGGFKYLENYELKLVWDLCTSRNELLDAYPNRIVEIDFLATLDTTAPFPVGLAALGALGYWGIGRFATKAPRVYRPAGIAKREPIVKTDTAKGGIRYADAYLPDNDARFVWDFVRSAIDHGATAANYCELVGAERRGKHWVVRLRDTSAVADGGAPGPIFEMTARTIVNAAGPYVDGLNERWDLKTDHRIVFSKGIHLVVPRLTDTPGGQDRVLAFFDDTGRLFYVIPMAHRSVIGTTDTRTTDPDEGVTAEDRRFLLEQINARLHLDTPLTEDDIIGERCGVRPLVVKNDGDDRRDTDWTSLSRKHEIEIDTTKAVVTLFGGKLTDCLNVGAEVVEAVESLGVVVGDETPGWFGEPPQSEHDRFVRRARAAGLGRAPSIERDATMADVLWRRHGTAAFDVLDAIEADPLLGVEVLAESDLLRAELDVMARREMIVRLDDLVRRRTKLALVTPASSLATDPGMAEVHQRLALSPASPVTS